MKFAEFVKSCVLHEQTEIVSVLIANEKKIDIQELMYNTEVFTVNLPEGEVSMGSTIFDRKYNSLGYKNRALHECYENAGSYTRTIYAWWLIPYWLGESLIDLGEPVFRHYGCSWWGIYDLQYLGWYNSKALRAVFNQLYPS
ncbi:hypothetical protein J2T02_000294 [Chitinophaga terrae (ex Kim and Jung 2007)]|uniref:hypothetical protein n=1 Tax=Chitinophaga terrae (ex Kim and Jung 2007) TaxID=408074 RepID=UPI002783E9F8|nr:hypothetical protein [Chitinophaga terrae (ex Kim and Jung 2007)]MDQ0105211.1 hypothetical protein [Chitinophaga terrae (ex Kim and Jung 2007)]